MKKHIYSELSAEELTDKISASLDQRFLEIQSQLEPIGKELLSTKEAQSFLKVSRGTLYNWMNEGRIQGLKLGDRLYFRKEDIMKALRPFNVKKDRHELR